MEALSFELEGELLVERTSSAGQNHQADNEEPPSTLTHAYFTIELFLSSVGEQLLWVSGAWHAYLVLLRAWHAFGYHSQSLAHSMLSFSPVLKGAIAF